MSEAILEPDLAIVDPHHHLWDRFAPPPATPYGVHGFFLLFGGVGESLRSRD